jgi:Pyruvate/2-oxoacid:ferredoxin oxidoreductase gamma subunit
VFWFEVMVMAKKAKKTKVPKRVAGVKVPKFLRDSTILQTLLASPIGRDILANALVAAAGAAAAIIIEEREQIADAAKDGMKKGGRVAGTIGDAMKSAATAAIGSVAEAARSVLPETEPVRSKAQGGRSSARH